MRPGPRRRPLQLAELLERPADARLDVHQPEQLGALGGVAHEAADRVVELVEGSVERWVERGRELCDLLAERPVDRRVPEALLGAEALVDEVVADAELAVERAHRHAVVAVGRECAECSIEDLLERDRGVVRLGPPKEVVSMFSRKLTRFVAAGAAAVAVAIGGVAISNSSSSNSASGAANVAERRTGPRTRDPAHPSRQDTPIGPGAPVGPDGPNPARSLRLASQDEVRSSGAAAEKAKAAALAKYSGTVNRVLQLSDGSYAVHMFATSGPHHVFVSKEFKVTGTA